MTNEELLKSYMDQLALGQQSFRDDLRAMQARMDAREARSDERWDAQQVRMEAQQARSDERWDTQQARMEAQQARSDERMEVLARETRRDMRTTLWSGLAFAAAIFGTIVGLLLAFVH